MSVAILTDWICYFGPRESYFLMMTYSGESGGGNITTHMPFLMTMFKISNGVKTSCLKKKYLCETLEDIKFLLLILHWISESWLMQLILNLDIKYMSILYAA